MIRSTLVSVLGLALLSFAAPLQEPDAPFSVSASAVEAAITCPNGVGKSRGGAVLLVHGTGSTGSESWQNGPYDVYLPKMQPGFDICWVDLPQRGLIDAQISAEYVALGVISLAKKSTTGKVVIIGHSQGAGLNPQWALDFWPSIRPLVSAYIALAPDFHGTIESAFCRVTGSKVGCQQSVWQQATGSNYMRAQNIDGDQALVPTTSLYTLNDEVVTPEIGPLYSARLDGASIVRLQDLDICGPTKVVDHFLMVVDATAFGLAYNALLNGGHVDRATFDRAYCTGFKQNVLHDFTGIASTAKGVFQDVTNGFFHKESQSKAEPLLKPYVCKRYPDQGFDCAA
ncbi:hypothetical protein BOTBODRAFT_185568 [Botryobasidium botryosum FD-172 SS1]|uniref:AB hydrolase-1 domain-containing protein n=1 Tax=Botryobasidium botryosum (strain FD-172 SS1) TaxID=930990 RepID=A0A067N358_BOTB1|nr:hypothetical protein BOTBODRAFT_185568 [Botryobasidium botryosum FD-172 SS1]